MQQLIAKSLRISGLSLAFAVFLVPSIGTAQITEIIDTTGDGLGNTLDYPWAIAVDGSGNVYVTGTNSDNAFQITPGGAITEIIDATGDGLGNPLDWPAGVAVDGSGNVYLTCQNSNNAFKITQPGGVITEIIDATGDGAGNGLDQPRAVAVDESGTVYVAGAMSVSGSDVGAVTSPSMFTENPVD